MSTNNKEILIDEADLELVSQHPWTVSPDGYAKKYFENWNGGKNRKRWVVHMHRLIMGAEKGQLVDHINQNTLDNRRSNLRFCNRSLNALNSLKTRSILGFRGITKNANGGKYSARITLNNRVIHLGSFETPEKAHKAYLTKQKELTA